MRRIGRNRRDVNLTILITRQSDIANSPGVTKRGIRYLTGRDSPREYVYVMLYYNNKHVINYITRTLHAVYAVRVRSEMQIESNGVTTVYRKIRVCYSSHEMWVRSCSS